MPTSNTYLALTIGPIYKTLHKAKNTQSLWGTSYVFSYLMKQICLELVTTYRDDFVIPYVKDDRIFAPHGGAGLFPDRIIIKGGKIEDLQSAVGKAINKLASDKTVAAINEEIEENNKVYKKKLSATSKDEFRNYLFRYLLLGVVEVRVNVNENVIDSCGKALSTLELQCPYYSEEKADLLYFLVQNISKSGLIEDAFGIDSYRFPSIIEITTAEIAEKYPEDYKRITNHSFKYASDEDNLLGSIKTQLFGGENIFYRYYKYMAIVKADGDNMGEGITKVYEVNPGKVEEIDKAILDFNLKAVRDIESYGGKSIYLGGDDLLFFAPVSSGGRTIFELVKQLSDDYNAKVGGVFNGMGGSVTPKPTLSFGISITYYKYPMNEALDLAGKMLEQAKENDKNAVAFRVMKHSGQFFGTRLPQDKAYYSQAGNKDNPAGFLDLLKSEGLEKEDTFLSSVMYRLQDMEYLIHSVLKSDGARVRLENFFENNFNEGIHQVKRRFLKQVAGYLWEIYVQTDNDLPKALETTYSTLRLIQFIHQKDSENDK